jgi:Holliday junction resolvasome RuvABC ATP-dependent DNA helicase subunit
MFANEYLNHEHHKDLLREARQQRLAQNASLSVSATQRAGRALLALGARFAVEHPVECYTVETREQIVTVCPAAC